MTTVIRTSEPADLLSLVPHLAECTPRESLVLVPFAARRTLGAMRVDLPRASPDGGGDLAEYAATVVGMLCRVQGATRVAVVVYTDSPYRDPDGRIARASLVQEVIRRADECGLELVDALCVAADGWGAYLEPDGPFAGRPLSDIRPDDFEFDDDRPIDVSRAQSDGCELPPSDLAERELVARELSRISLRLGDATLPAVIEHAIEEEADDLPPRALALLIHLLDRPALRDVALTQWCGGYDEGVATQAWQLAWSRGDVALPDGPLRLAGEGPRPKARRLERALELAKRLASCAPRAHRAGPLVAAAWLSWALGRSTHAAHFTGLVRELDPDHGLADILTTMLAAGHLPEWVFDRPVPRGRARRAKRRGRR
ncbi:DUF4192 family protein [Microbacterium lacusdiani]